MPMDDEPFKHHDFPTEGMDWTAEQWQNLRQNTAKLESLLSQPKHKRNRAWRTMLRLTLSNIADYHTAMRRIAI
jgi:hypothetical protein